MIDITLIGTSALLPLPQRALTSVFLSCDGRSILFDCGEGTQTAARKSGISLIQVDMIALTHYHGDHIFGIPGLLQTMCCMGRTEPLYITGPKGLEASLAPIMSLVGWTSYDVVLVEIKEEGIELSQLVKGWKAGAILKPFKTEHKVVSQGYCFTLNRAGKFMPRKAEELSIPKNMWGLLQKGQSVQLGEKIFLPEHVLGEERKGLKFVFSGDTTMCDNLVRAAENADLLICEATYAENEQKELAIEHGHMNFAMASMVAAKSGSKELWLTHYSQMIDNPENYIKNAKDNFKNTVCGYDGMKTTLRFQQE